MSGRAHAGHVRRGCVGDALRGRHVGVQASRGVLVAGRREGRQRSAADPVVGRPARPREVPAAARPAVLTEEDGRARTRDAQARRRGDRCLHRPRRVRLPRGIRHAAPVDVLHRLDGAPAVGPPALLEVARRHDPTGRRLDGGGAGDPRGDGPRHHGVLRARARGTARRTRRRPPAQHARARRGRGPAVDARRAARHVPPAHARWARHRDRDPRLHGHLPRDDIPNAGRRSSTIPSSFRSRSRSCCATRRR